jgi:poly-gamma-glutamate capsule biosynthesis protein CapA/YwtB (metallophosphatase superfamily)
MNTTTLLLTGDVMTGRGIDQVMPHPVSPELYESWVRDAGDYVGLAERVNGPIAAPVALDYIWGDALAEMERRAPDVRIVNLETAVTTAATPAPRKGIHYRMSPAHVGCLTAARIDACGLANNHVLDWGAPGLTETLATLHGAGVRTAGAGPDLAQAEAPAVLRTGADGRVLLYAWGTPSSGVPTDWAARDRLAGVALLTELDESAARRIAEQVTRARRPGDVVVVSLHWGENWVARVPVEHRRFARRLIELGAADIVHGHSSHHPLPAEVVAGKLVLYGCGDLINDYEGIESRGELRSDLGCLYFATVDRTSGRLQQLRIVPMQLRRFRLGAAGPDERAWLERLLHRGGASLGTRVEADRDGSWLLRWS